MRLAAFVVGVLFALSGPQRIAGAEGAGPTSHVLSAVAVSSADALQQDLQSVAQAHGWTLADATANQHAAEVVGKINKSIAKDEPGSFIVPAWQPTQTALRHFT